MKNDNENNLWNKFQMSGSVSDYLNYKSQKTEIKQGKDIKNSSMYNSELSAKKYD